MNSPYGPGQPPTPQGSPVRAYAPVQPQPPAYGYGQQPMPVFQVTVTDVNMSFRAMVNFMVKWALASIPAAIILMVIGAAVWTVVAGMFFGLLASHR